MHRSMYFNHFIHNLQFIKSEKIKFFINISYFFNNFGLKIVGKGVEYLRPILSYIDNIEI